MLLAVYSPADTMTLQERSDVRAVVPLEAASRLPFWQRCIGVDGAVVTHDGRDGQR